MSSALRRSVFLACLAGLACGGCATLRRTTVEMRVKDPAAVALSANGATVVPAGGPFPARKVLEKSGDAFRAERDAAGALRMEVPSHWALRGPEWSTLVAADGTVTDLVRDQGLQLGDVVTAPVCGASAKGGRCLFSVTLTTPKDNVRFLVRSNQPDRFSGVLLGILAATMIGTGTFFLSNAPGDRQDARGVDLAVGAPNVIGGSAILGWALWYLLGPEYRTVLVGADPRP